MKRHINLFLTLSSLFVTAFLLILSIYGWYVTNNRATASGILGVAEGIKGDFTFYYWKDESVTDPDTHVTTLDGEWVRTNNDLKINDAWPDDVFYYKIYGHNLTVGEHLKISFSDITSMIDTNVVKAYKEDSKYNVKFSGITQYVSNTTDVNVLINDTNKTLYKLTESEDLNSNECDIELKDVLIHEAFYVYTSPVISAVGDITDFPIGKGSQKKDLETSIYEGTVTSNEMTIYFALSFDSTIYDNYYQYQGLNIQHISITH